MWSQTSFSLALFSFTLFNLFFYCPQYIGRTGGRIQQQAGSALLDVATSGSGAAGCARASADEIDSLLVALQNPSAVVRDAALRVSVTQMYNMEVVKYDFQPVRQPSFGLIHQISLRWCLSKISFSPLERKVLITLVKGGSNDF
jgi:hypothetical protein